MFDPPSRLSHSALWRLNHSYYSSYGHLPFANGTVPHFITSNAYTAHHTAQVILAHLLAHPPQQLPAPQQPLYIVEAGAGHARHTFLTLQALSALVSDTAASSTARLPAWRYVCTDISMDGLRALRCHPSLQPFIHAQRLDFALLSDDCYGVDGGSGGGGGGGYELHCLVSGDVISRHTNQNPILLSAAYTLSALACDAWQQRPDGLYEGRISLWTEQADGDCIDRTDPQLLQRLTERWEWVRVDSKQADTYYPPKLQSVFEQSVKRLAGVAGSSQPCYSFLFPVSALLLLYRFLSLSHNQLTLLVLDKAHTLAADTAATPDALRPPHLARHGSTSVMLSLLPLHIAVEAVRYGVTETSGWREGGFVASLMSTQLPTAGTVVVRLAFQRLKGLTPDGFSVLIRCVRDGEAGLGVLCWLLRLAHHDCDVYYRVSHRLLALLHETVTNDKQRADLIRDCQQLMRNYYPLDVYQPPSNAATSAAGPATILSPLFTAQHRDVAFELGRLCLALSTHSAALLCFECSWRDCGPHALTAYYLSMCEWLMGRQAKGRKWLGVAERLAEGEEEVEVLKAWRRTVDGTDENGTGHGSNDAGAMTAAAFAR